MWNLRRSSYPKKGILKYIIRGFEVQADDYEDTNGGGGCCGNCNGA